MRTPPAPMPCFVSWPHPAGPGIRGRVYRELLAPSKPGATVCPHAQPRAPCIGDRQEVVPSDPRGSPSRPPHRTHAHRRANVSTYSDSHRPERCAVLLVAGDKAGQWSAWYREAIPLAETRYAAYLKEREQ